MNGLDYSFSQEVFLIPAGLRGMRFTSRDKIQRLTRLGDDVAGAARSLS